MYKKISIAEPKECVTKTLTDELEELICIFRSDL